MILAGTGHRPNKLGGYGAEARFRLIDVAIEQLNELQPIKVISGMALGWDTALAEAALQLKLPLVAAVPFSGQESMWPFASRQRFKELLSQASEVHYVCAPGYAAWKMQVRNQWMVDECDVLLALWNGTKGGTANCVGYALGKQVKLVNCWNAYKKHLTALGE